MCVVSSTGVLAWAVEKWGPMVNYLCGTVQSFVSAETPVLQEWWHGLTTWSYEDKFMRCQNTVVTGVLSTHTLDLVVQMQEDSFDFHSF